ncbi:TPA: glycine rich domain-containing protein [Clostridioides difficile]
MAKVYDFNYIHGEQEVVLPPGKYLLECWGAAGGGGIRIVDFNLRSKGGYSKGELTLRKETTLYVYAGEKGSNYDSSFNGGGKAMMHEGPSGGGILYCNGGGATDIRLIGGSWDNEQSLLSRIIVAGGGGRNNFETKGGDGGGDAGGDGSKADSKGTQTNGGKGEAGLDGSFGKGGSAVSASSGENYGGGGGGWYGGGSGYNAGGGSGYVLTENSYKPAGYIPTKEYWLENTSMTVGGGIAEENGKARITLLQGLPFLVISSYTSQQAIFTAGHTEENKLSKIEVFIDDVLKETFTTDLYLEKTINYTLEDNALHTLKIVVTDINNMTYEQVVTISKSIMPLQTNANLQDISTKLVEIGESFKNGKTSIINTLALKNIEASLNNTLVELSEKIKASFDSGDASIEDLTNKLTQANNTISQLNSKYKVASGNSVVNSCVNKYGFYHGSDYLFLFPGVIQINGLNFVPNIFFTTFELIDDGYFHKYFVFACRGIFTQDFVITAHYRRLETYLKDFKVEGEVLKLNERDVYMDNRGIQLPCQRQGSSFKWQAIKFI